MTNIIAFCGKAGAGKTTASRYICNNYIAHPLSFAAPLRMMVAPLAFVCAQGIDDHANHFLYEGKDSEMPIIKTSARKLYQGFGDVMRAEYSEVFIDLFVEWVKVVRAYYKSKIDEEITIVVDDVRYENEAIELEKLGAHIVQVERAPSDLRKVPKHSSEKGVPPEYINMILPNLGTVEELEATLIPLCKFWGLKKASAVSVNENKLRVH